MKEYVLEPASQTLLDKAFASHPRSSDQEQRLEALKTRLEQAARFLMKLTPAGPEQTLAVRALQECYHWGMEAIEKCE